MRLVAMIGRMRLGRLLAAIGFSLSLVVPVNQASAGEVVVFSTIAARALVQQLGPKFEAAAGHRLKLRFDTALAIKREIEAGARFDAAILTEQIASELEGQGKLISRKQRPFAHVLVGLAGRSGGPKRDIATADSFVATLRAAEKIAYAEDGASGSAFVRLLEKLDVYDQFKSKLVPAVGGRVMEIVAAGEATYGVQLISEIVSAPGVELVGPFPEKYQTITRLAIARSSDTNDAHAAAQFVAFMTSPSTNEAITAAGMIPQ